MDRTIDLNADIGEGSDDAPILELVTSVSIACGGHAGDEGSMKTAIKLAKRHGVHIGAHPSFPDRDGFGRVRLEMPLGELRVMLLEQVEALMRVADRMRATVFHCKPHGALYTQAASDPILAAMIAETLAERHPELVLVGLANSHLTEAGRDHGLKVVEEAFADRRYEPDGSLRPRRFLDAVITEPDEAATQAAEIASGGFPMISEVGTICVHGDTPGALAITRAVREKLTQAGFTIAPVPC
ncbi:MAG: 5-oxoprolinase subunit PxpA [Actinomycetota bacterium]